LKSRAVYRGPAFLWPQKRPQAVTPAAHFGRTLPLRQPDALSALLPVTPPAHYRCGDDSRNDRSGKIVPESDAKLRERHIAASIAITTVRGYS